MPTAAKLFGAITLAALGWFASYIIVLHALPGGGENQGLAGWFKEVNAVLAFFIGWRVLGRGTGETIWLSITSGFVATFILYALGLFIQGFYAMIMESLNSTYRSPEAALEAMTGFISKYAVMSLHPYVMGVLIGGATLCGMITHVAARKWR